MRHPLLAVTLAFACTVPWVGLFGVSGGYGTVHPGENIPPVVAVLVAGFAIVGAAFVLAWAAETAEKDVPRAFAIVVLAVLAVAPEYAVDALYAWEAGAGSAEAANLAVANMTGANRILIGLGWAGIALYTIYRVGRDADRAVVRRDGVLGDAVRLDRSITVEITFLLVATAYAFMVPLGGGIGPVDTVFLVGLYLAYLLVVVRGDVEEPATDVGVPAYFHGYSRASRLILVIVGFAFSGAVIFTAVHPFAEGLERLGLQYGIPEFFMIQWLAPLASESPELIVVAYLVTKARSTAGFNALISSKLNQWTLLIGTLAVVYSISAGQVGTLSFHSKQTAEVLVTAAQSLFAVAILVNLEISAREALALLGLFASQVMAEFTVVKTYADPEATTVSIRILYAYTAVYLLLSVVLFGRRWNSVQRLLRRIVSETRMAIVPGWTQSEGD